MAEIIDITKWTANIRKLIDEVKSEHRHRFSGARERELIIYNLDLLIDSRQYTKYHLFIKKIYSIEKDKEMKNESYSDLPTFSCISNIFNKINSIIREENRVKRDMPLTLILNESWTY